MKLHGLTPVVSLETFGSRDTAARPFGRIIAAYELLKNLRPDFHRDYGLGFIPERKLGVFA